MRVALAVAAMVTLALGGLAFAAFGLVPHRVPTPTIDTAADPHDFPDLEALLPPGAAARQISSGHSGTTWSPAAR